MGWERRGEREVKRPREKRRGSLEGVKDVESKGRKRKEEKEEEGRRER